MDRTAGPVIEAGGRALVGRVSDRLDSFLRRVKERAPDQPLDFDDRMAIKILQEVGTVDDEVLTDYLGGVLLSSSEDHRKDQGTSVLATVAGLSTMQIRGHYAIYTAYRRLLLGQEVNFYHSGETAPLSMFVDQDEFFASVAVDPERPPTPHPTPHVTRGLAQAGLLENLFGGSEASMLRDFGLSDAERAGFVVRPSPLGAELFLWGHGADALDARALTSPDVRLHDLLAKPPALDSARLVKVGGQA